MLKSSINIREATCNSRELKALRLTENYMQVALRSLENICSISRFLEWSLVTTTHSVHTHTHAIGRVVTLHILISEQWGHVHQHALSKKEGEENTQGGVHYIQAFSHNWVLFTGTQ